MPSGQAWDTPSTSEIDWGPAPPEFAPELLDLSNAGGWERAVTFTRQAEQALLAAFNAVPQNDAHFGYLAANALQVLAAWRPSLMNVPAYLRRAADSLVQHKDLIQLPFSNRFTPVPTDRRPRPSQTAFTTYRPTSYYEILSADAIDSILEWLSIEHSNMVALKQFGPEVRRVKNARAKLGFGLAVEPHDVLVIGQDQFLEPAQGIIWDCRGFEHGLPAVPLNFNAPVSSDL